jgi:hypothetical protein
MCGLVASADDFRGRMAMRGPVHLVLHNLKELPRHLGVRVIVDARGIDVGDLLIEHSLAGANISNTGEQLIKVGIAESPPSLDAFVVERETLD